MSLLKNRPLACACLFIFLGALSAYLFYSGGMREFARIPLFLLAIAFIFSIFLIRRGGFLLTVLLLSLLIGYGSQALYNHRNFSDISAMDSGKIHHIEARVFEFDTAENETVCTVSVRTINERDASGTLKLTVSNSAFHPHKNDIISCDVMILEQADAYLYQRGIAAHVLTEECPRVLEKGESGALDSLSEWNSTLRTRLKTGLSEEGSALLSALLLGNREELAPSIARDFRRAGLSHMLALSGLHLSILAMSVLAFLRKLGTPQLISFPLLLIFVTFYAAISGFPLSLLRAAGMLLLSELGRLLRLSSDSITSLFASVTTIFLISPGAIVDVGLALSFLATLGILVAISVFPKQEGKVPFFKRVLRGSIFGIIATLAATMFTLLLSILVFGEISLISPISNLLISPLLHILLLLGPFALAFPSLMNPIVSFFSGITTKIVSFLSSIPGIYIGASHPLFVIITLLFSALLIFFMIDTRISRRALRYYMLSGFAVLLITLTSSHMYTANRDYMCYSRTAGTEFLILQSDRTVTVVDNGGNAYAAELIRCRLKENHITEIDTLVITRYTKQTATLIRALSERIIVHSILLCPSDTDYAVLAKQATEKCGATLIHGEKGEQTIDGDLTMTLFPAIGLTEKTDGFFMRLDFGESRICYAPAHALAIADHAAVESFTKHADLVIVGAAPSFSGVFSDKGLYPDATVIIGSVANAPETAIQKQGTVIAPRNYYMPLK